MIYRERQNLAAQVKNLEHENDNLRVHADEEAEVTAVILHFLCKIIFKLSLSCSYQYNYILQGKAECLRQMSKLNAEIQQWKARFEGEGLAKMEEIEEAK